MIRLRLANFRNYVALDLPLQPRSVVFTGDNGAGKTNLLEAISMLTPGRGLRRATYEEMAREGSGDGFAIHATLDGPLWQFRESARERPARHAGESGRRVRINGATAKSAEALLEWVRVVWLTPAMDALFTGPASGPPALSRPAGADHRPRHGQRALDYEKAMRGRNRLLAEGGARPCAGWRQSRRKWPRPAWRSPRHDSNCSGCWPR